MKYDTVMFRVYVTDKGPIDNYAPGADVSFVYRGDKLERLVKEGFLVVVEESLAPADELADDIDAVADDGQPADEDGE